jgi:hypothetical protein
LLSWKPWKEFPNLPALWLRQAKPASAYAISFVHPSPVRQDWGVFELLNRLAHAYVGLAWPVKLGLTVGIPLLTFLFGVVLALWVPADFFVREQATPNRHAAVRLAARILKNLVGWILLPLGILMALPLVPGPGLVFILLGVSLVDFPRKRRLEERLLGYPPVFQAVNRMRQRFGRVPIQIRPHPPARLAAGPESQADR